MIGVLLFIIVLLVAMWFAYKYFAPNSAPRLPAFLGGGDAIGHFRPQIVN